MLEGNGYFLFSEYCTCQKCKICPSSEEILALESDGETI